MENKKNDSFGSFVKDLRHNKGLSIKNLGSKLDINYSYISKIENDHCIPSEIFINTARSLLLPLRDEQLDLFKFENPANIRNEKGGLVENIKFNVYYLEPEQNRVLRALNKIDWKNILHNEWMFSEKMDK